jgi:hypothetical protein
MVPRSLFTAAAQGAETAQSTGATAERRKTRAATERRQTAQGAAAAGTAAE